eukprot:COSAG06_NODE_19930_length_817_cov_1.289694_1_plen_224_part_10
MADDGDDAWEQAALRVSDAFEDGDLWMDEPASQSSQGEPQQGATAAARGPQPAARGLAAPDAPAAGHSPADPHSEATTGSSLDESVDWARVDLERLEDDAKHEKLPHDADQFLQQAPSPRQTDTIDLVATSPQATGQGEPASSTGRPSGLNLDEKASIVCGLCSVDAIKGRFVLEATCGDVQAAVQLLQGNAPTSSPPPPAAAAAGPADDESAGEVYVLRLEGK